MEKAYKYWATVIRPYKLKVCLVVVDTPRGPFAEALQPLVALKNTSRAAIEAKSPQSAAAALPIS